MRRWRVPAAVIVVVGLVAFGLYLVRRDESGGRPVPDGDEVVRVVGGSSTFLAGLDEGESVDATDVDGSNLVAMAVQSDGTLWLVDVSGHLYRATTDGKVVRVPLDRNLAIDELAAATIDQDGTLHTVGDASTSLYTLDTSDVDAGWRIIELQDMPDEFVLTGVAVAPDGTVYVADDLTGIVYQLDVGDDAARATAVPGTPIDGCDPERLLSGIAVAATNEGGQVVVAEADNFCPEPYRPGTGPVAPNPTCPTKDTGVVVRADVVLEWAPGELVVGGQDGGCAVVWHTSLDGGEPAIAMDPSSPISGRIRALAVDSNDMIYVLDGSGVVAARLEE